MESFRSSVLIEIIKMYRRKKIRVILILSVAVIVFVQLISSVVRGRLGILWNTSSVFPITVLSVISYTLIPLLIILLIIDAFTNEFSHNTMKLSVTRPVSRFKIYLSKLTAIAVLIFFNLITVMILSSFVGVLFNPVSFSLSGFIRILVSYIVTMFPMIAFAVVIAFFANIFKSSASVFFTSVLIFLISSALGLIFSRISGMFLTSSLDWYKLWISNSMPIGKIVSQFTMMTGYVILFLSAGYYKFDRRDL
ncbi:MAG: ABC transporter permease [Eubacteriales bacterium]|nr:ABC transporter permease [Eubacteriales bacterium]NCU26667.1 ABC transporter permease [Candidatus Nomurabacteria bacterium]